MATRKPLAQVTPRRILIIGGGATGLAALRALVDEESSGRVPFDEVTLVERREDIGGVWYMSEETLRAEQAQREGHADGQWPVVSPSTSKPLWPSPSYPALRGNVLPRFLSLSGAPPFPAPAHGETFPTLAETHAYLRSVAEPVQRHIRCQTEVLGAWELPPVKGADGLVSPGGWAVRTRDWSEQGAGRATTEMWDAIVVATGWYDSPCYPPVPGLTEAVSAKLVHHAKWYRSADLYSPQALGGKKMVVCGNGNSANDACSHLAAQRTAGRDEPVYRSIIEAQRPVFVSLPDERIRDVPAVKRYVLRHPSDGSTQLDVELVDGSIIENCFVLLGIGYEIGTVPFVHLLQQPEVADSAMTPTADWVAEASALAGQWAPLTPPARWTGAPPTAKSEWPPRLAGLHFQLLHAVNPSLAFSGLPVSNTPFVLADVESRYIRCIFDGSFVLPTDLAGRLADETARVELLRSRQAEVQAIDAELRADWEQQRAAGDAKAIALAAPPQLGPQAFHVLPFADDEAVYANELMRRIFTAKPHMQSVLPPWDAEREVVRKGMYQRKYETLLAHRRRRLAQGTDHRSARI